MSSEPWTIRPTPQYLQQISMFSLAEQEKIGIKVTGELSQRPHPSRPEQTEERLILHFPGIEPASSVLPGVAYELRYEIRALSKELTLVSIRRLDFLGHSYSL
jgi:hypothetical protein